MDLHRFVRMSPLNRLVWRISLPVTAAMVTQTAIMITDALMVGRLGAPALAATSLGGMVFWAILAFFMGASFGVQIIVARRFGAANYAAAGRILVTGIILALLIGGIVQWFAVANAEGIIALLSRQEEYSGTAIDFVRIRFLGIVPYFLVFVVRAFFDGAGRTEIGLYGAVATMIANIFGNWVLIYGNLGFSAYGTDGAAMASSLASIPGLLIELVFLFQQPFRSAIRAGFGFEWNVVREISYVGFAPALDNFLMNVSFTLFYVLADMISTNSVAVTGIIVSLLSLSFMPGFGFSVAATTILGQAVAAGKHREARFGVQRAALFAVLLMTGMGMLFIIFGRPLLWAFTDDARVLAEALPALIIVSLVQGADGYHMVMAAALRSAGIVYWVLAVYAFCSFMIMLPTAYFFGVYLGYDSAGLWSGIAVWIALLSLIFGRKFRSGEWRGVEI